MDMKNENDCFTPALREKLDAIRAHVAATYLPRYLFEHDHDVSQLKKLADKYSFTFDLVDLNRHGQ